VNGTKELSVDAAYQLLNSLPGESIYNEPFRIAQPDEVWNYLRGDGLEKAICLANAIRSKNPDAGFAMENRGKSLSLIQKDGKSYTFASEKSVLLPLEKDFIF
jgi:hypothetical protein